MFASWHTRILVFYRGTTQLLNLTCVKHEYVAIWVPINQASYAKRKSWESQHTLNKFLPVLWNINLHLLSCTHSSHNTLSVSLSLNLLNCQEKTKGGGFCICWTGSQILGIKWTWKKLLWKTSCCPQQRELWWEKRETTFAAHIFCQISKR